MGSLDDLSPCRDLVPAAQGQARGRGIGVDEEGLLTAAKSVGRPKRPAGTGLASGATAPAVPGARLVEHGLAADGAGEVVEGLEVALAGEQEPGPAVVPDRPGFLRAVSGLDLGQVVEAEQRLDALPRARRDVGGQPRDPGEVGDLVEAEEQARIQYAAPAHAP